MNQFTEAYRRKAKSKSSFSRKHEQEVAQAQTSKGRQRLTRWVIRMLLTPIALAGIGYFFATASLTAILIAVGLLLALSCALVVFGLYVLDNVR